MVKIGHARFSEKGNAEGKRGDQTGNEVSITAWYDGTWLAVYRPQSDNTAFIIADTMESATKNNNIGYGQSDRLTLMKAAEQCNFDLSKITEPVNCDCSSLVAVCCNAAGVGVPFSMTTRSMDLSLMGTGKFIRMKDSRYLKTPNYLKRGDILRKNGHTAIVLSNGSKYTDEYEIHNTPVIYADNRNDDLRGIYETTTDLYLRIGAGAGFQAVSVMPYKQRVFCYGNFSYDSNSKVWVYVDSYIDGKKLTGFCSYKHLVKVGDIQ